MNGKCIFRGKNFFASALLAAAILAAMALLFSCGDGSASSGDSYVSGDLGTGGNGTGGGDNTGNEGNEGEDNGGENGNESGDEKEDSKPQQKEVKDLLKEIIGYVEYDEISAKVAGGNLTLTAEMIKTVGDYFPTLETDAENGKEAKDVENADVILQNKEGFVPRAENAINVSKDGNKYTVTYGDKKIKFSGEFNLSEISFPTNNGNGDFSAATLTNDGASITIDKLNTIRGTSLPTLIFNKNETNVKETNTVSGENIYNLYKAYSGNLNKLLIKGTMSSSATVDGKEISGEDNYTLLKEDGNTVKSAEDSSVKSLPVDALIQMYKQLKISYFVDMIISGDAKEAIEVDWTLTNIVFEGDMSKIKNTGNKDLTGIVYFKKKAYNNTGKQSVNGLLKLDDLEGVSNGTFNVFLNNRSAVLDVRGVGQKADTYTGGGILAGGGYAHAIYFSDDFSGIKDNQSAIDALCDRFSNNQEARFIYAYLGNNKVKGQSYDKGNNSNEKTFGTPRTLKDFEYFGNNRKFSVGDEYYALNNKRCFSSTAKSLG